MTGKEFLTDLRETDSVITSRISSDKIGEWEDNQILAVESAKIWMRVMDEMATCAEFDKKKHRNNCVEAFLKRGICRR